ncbi:dihydrofolate reductase [Humidisolicoccus flavus]|uniref:dihydrofolate reductase n=1 Tax=Humidisolicoccus flavus TaxID=3111414 RepID=UPI003243D5C4
MTRLGLIWAEAGGVIGADGGMPWHIPEDLRHFRDITQGFSVIMGRRTWESLPQQFRPLKNRRNIVITRSQDFVAEGAEIVPSFEAAMQAVAEESEAWVIGGGKVYAEAINAASVLEVTEINLEVDGDTHAPRITDDWSERDTSDWKTSSTGFMYRFRSFVRPDPALDGDVIAGTR